jgi:hypothetical protein
MTDNPYEASQAAPLKRRQATGHLRSQPISPREVFGIVVRAIGLIAILYGFDRLVGMFFPDPAYSSVDYLIANGPIVVAGAIVFFGADTVVSLAYGTRYMERYDEPSAPEESTEER